MKSIFAFTKKLKSENSIQHFCYRGSTHPKQRQWRSQDPSPGTILSISASGCHNFEPCLWASVSICVLSWFILASICKMCSKVPEKPKKGYFGGLKMLKIFRYQLMVIVSLLYTISAYQRFYGNTILDSRENLFKSHVSRGAWVAQSVECPTSAQVMISLLMGLSPHADSSEPGDCFGFCVSLPVCPSSCLHSLSQK